MQFSECGSRRRAEKINGNSVPNVMKNRMGGKTVMKLWTGRSMGGVLYPRGPPSQSNARLLEKHEALLPRYIFDFTVQHLRNNL